jgi:hypothetical protein
VFCPKCGAQNPEGSHYCQGCGAALAVAPQAPPTIIAYPPLSAPPQEVKRTSGMAVAALVMGILGFIFGLPAVLAIIFGGIALSETGKNPNIGGRGMAVAGLILGIIVLVGGLLTLVLVVILAVISVPVYTP